ncbi:MAG: cytochrome C oxidase subunit IV family protein [Chloroflexales bacterium]
MANARDIGHEGGHDREGSYGHIPVRTYWVVFSSLMVLMVLTVAAWYVEKHFVQLPEIVAVGIAMAIAIAKTALIIYFFMHVKVSSKLTQIFAVSAFVWLMILFVIVMGDYMARGWPPARGPLTQAPAPRAAAAPVSQGWRAL